MQKSVHLKQMCLQSPIIDYDYELDMHNYLITHCWNSPTFEHVEGVIYFHVHLNMHLNTFFPYMNSASLNLFTQQNASWMGHSLVDTF